VRLIGGGIAAGVNVGQQPDNPNLSKQSHSVIEIVLLFSVFAIFEIFDLHGMTDGKYSMLVSESLRRMCGARPRHHASRTGVALIPMAADKRRMAAECDLHRRHHLDC
jgi:hypothetical protein